LFTKQSIAEISQSLENPSTDPKYYHRKKQFRLAETAPPCLVKIDPPGKYDLQRLVRQLIRKAFLKTTVKVVKNKKNYYNVFNYYYYLIN
jgi:hypothetical protein